MDSNKFSNGIIYKIVSKDINITECYIGSTINFKERKRKHITHCNNENSIKYNYKLYKFIRDNGGFNNFEIIEIKKYPSTSKRELELEEQKQYEIYGGELNSQYPTRTRKEYLIDNKEKIKEYYQENKEKYNEKFKKYYVDNKEKLKEQMKEYYLNNLEKIKEKNNKKIKCECGGRYTRINKARHNKTKKHLKYLSTI